MELTIKNIACALLIIGGLNWGVVGATGKDLVGGFFGPKSTVARVIFLLVGLAALVSLAIALGAYEGFATATTPAEATLKAKGAIGKALAAATGATA
jgi:uncharacterized membrane protein YuzA (DUF378 family)